MAAIRRKLVWSGSVLGALLSMAPAQASTLFCTSVAGGGAWTSPSTWSNCAGSYPGVNALSNTYNVTVASNVSVGTLFSDSQLLFANTLTVNPGTTLDLGD